MNQHYPTTVVTPCVTPLPERPGEKTSTRQFSAPAVSSRDCVSSRYASSKPSPSDTNKPAVLGNCEANCSHELLPTISVLVPVRNEERYLERTLRALLTQDYPSERYEVIVADGMSEDGTVAIVRRLQREYPQLRLVCNPRRWSSAGRNAAWKASRGELILIVDGHCHIPDDQYLRRVADLFTATGADCLARPQPLEVPEATPFQQAVALARRSWLGHNPDSDIFAQIPRFVPAQNTAVAYRREVFFRVGLFDESFDACEDVEFNTRVDAAGLRCYFAPQLRVHYEPRRSFAALFRQLCRYGTGRARLAFKHPHALTFPALIPPLGLMLLVTGVLVSALWPPFALIVLLALLAYVLLLGLVSLHVAYRHPWPVRWRVPLAFIGIHFGFAWGFVYETGQQLVRRLHKAAKNIIHRCRWRNRWNRWIHRRYPSNTRPQIVFGPPAL
ncbi:MAG: glycosyltransferase family 2 protein [Gemmataceae bacterium]|nr:glycosyltransferase family 2 protein [Gemmataceae bacterium]